MFGWSACSVQQSRAAGVVRCVDWSMVVGDNVMQRKSESQRWQELGRSCVVSEIEPQIITKNLNIRTAQMKAYKYQY